MQLSSTNLCLSHIIFISGKYWFERFKKDSTGQSYFVSPKSANETRNTIQTFNHWHLNTRTFVWEGNTGKLLPSAKNSFVIECEAMAFEEGKDPMSMNVLVGPPNQIYST